jgi:hypothetical protein
MLHIGSNLPVFQIAPAPRDPRPFQAAGNGGRQGIVGLVEVELLQEVLPQGIERLQDGVTHELSLLERDIGALARVD